ncbi:MAG: type II secretion system minor pseudopilin GspJ [Gammaproteobacteria bacterium]|jgi:general secretion pathway protein J|nr:type II secretion system minor pseudopilin GspJ [Gammaproteobacteria bacterium]
MRSGPAVCRGFTLLELLVALAIFGLLAAMSYGGLQAVLVQQSYTEQAADRLGELQKMYLVMQRDIEQIVPRIVRDEFGDAQQPLIGGDTLRLTRGGWRNPAGRQRSTLQRIGYAYEEQQLVRYTWSVLDRAQDSEPLKQPLIEDVERLQLRYLESNDVWKEQWPDAADLVDNEVAEGLLGLPALPKAVEVTIEHKMYGTLVWLFQLP